MIPLIALIVVAGGHPIALGILIAVFGLILGYIKGGSKLLDLTGTGVRGGLLIFLGLVGLLAQIDVLRIWAAGLGMELIFVAVIFITIITYAYLARINKKWIAIPLCSLFAVIVALVMGAPLEFVAVPGIPILNPFYWWGADTGWMLGLPNLGHFIAVLPFAILTIAMWPIDYPGHRVFQETEYPKGAEKALMNIDDSITVASIRQAIGSILGGGNITSSWGAVVIPAAFIKRPLAPAAILTGIACILVAVLGFPMDVVHCNSI